MQLIFLINYNKRCSRLKGNQKVQRNSKQKLDGDDTPVQQTGTIRPSRVQPNKNDTQGESFTIWRKHIVLERERVQCNTYKLYYIIRWVINPSKRDIFQYTSWNNQEEMIKITGHSLGSSLRPSHRHYISTHHSLGACPRFTKNAKESWASQQNKWNCS